MVQLYCWTDGEWHLVAQFDHNPGLAGGHDVRTEGVHMDVFKAGEKHETEAEPHPDSVKPAFALNYAINYLSRHDERLIERYRRWQTG